MYITYSEYEEYGGTLTETAFNDCELQAEMLIDWYTFNRLQNEKEYPEKLKKCMYVLIKYVALQSGLDGTGGVDASGNVSVSGGSIASQSNDGVSTSYNVLSAQELIDNAKSKIEDIIKMGLQGVVNSLGRKVLYRGLYPGE